MARTTTAPNGDAGEHKANGSAGFSHGAPASGSGAPARKHPLPHIDDITSVTIDLDRFTHMDKLLATAEELLRDAETYRNFGGRIDLAMKSYIRAYILLTDVIKKNKGWASLQAGDNKAQKRRYHELVRQVQASHGVFEQIKLDIKSDNARTGVQPTTHSSTNVNGGSLAASRSTNSSLDDGRSSDGILTPATSPTPSTAAPSIHHSPARAKPSVRPKPEALHGNTIHKGPDELSRRFANLRAPASAPQQLVQDPRIRTQPIVVPPSVQRQDVSVSRNRSSLSLETDSFDLPKMPGAIYKPARGTVSAEAAELPSSTPRRFSIQRSTTSGSVSSPSVRSPLTGLGEGPNNGAKRTKLSIPEGEILPVTELLRLMKEGSKSVSILIIDIRSREAFDEGHIMSQATICVEPEVLLRKNISASEISESMVLAPSAEQINFERRHQFDLIVFYDQCSTQIGSKLSNPEGAAVQGLYNALTHFDYAGENSVKPPKLLEGGLDAWTSVLGSSSLATTDSSAGQPKTRPRYIPARRQSHVPKPIQDPDEARRWEQSTNDPELFKPVSKEEFLRRFPSASAIQESMVSPPHPRTGDGNYNHSHAHIPPVPSRPPPTAAPHSNFGKDYQHDEVKKVPPRHQKEKGGNRTHVGLRNPGNWCYANSSLQALFGTSGFARELATGQWLNNYRVPNKSDEMIPNPQLLAKMLSQLFGWMDKALINPMEARTLMQYAKHIHAKDELGHRKLDSEVFGHVGYQHDAQEFFNYLLEVLHDETNKHRDQDDSELSSSYDNTSRSILHDAVTYWRLYTERNDSLVTKYWRGLTVSAGTCSHPECTHVTRAFNVFDIYTIPPGAKTLTAFLAEETRPQDPNVLKWKCEVCEADGRGRQLRKRRVMFCRLPDRLMFPIQRFNRALQKDRSRLEFPLRDLDMGPYCVPSSERGISDSDPDASNIANNDHHFRPPFKYDLYAVICHVGRQLKSGHYVAYVRDQDSDDPTAWIKFNDLHADAVRIYPGSDILDFLYGNGKCDEQAYLLFYQRQGT